MQRVAISLPALAVKDDANVAAGVHADEASLDLPAITIPSVLNTIIAGRKNITVLKTFRTQDEAFAYSDAGARLPLFARDLDARPDFSKAIAQGTSKKPDSRRGQKEYTRASYGRMLSYTRAMRPDQRRWYEILLANMWCNLFLDLDLCKTANPHLTTEACATMLTDIEAHLRAFIHENFPWLRSESPPDDANEGIRIVKLASSSAKKFSVHLVVHIRGVAFRDYRDCGAFIRRFSRYLVEKEGAPEVNRFFAWGEKTDLANLPTPSELGVLLRNEDYDARKNWKSFVDLKIYTIHRAFRCPGSHKEGDDMQTRKLWLLDELEMRIKTDWMSEAGALIGDELFYDSMIQYFDPDHMPTNLIACTEWDGSEPTGSSNAWSHLYDRSQINYLGKRSSSMSKNENGEFELASDAARPFKLIRRNTDKTSQAGMIEARLKDGLLHYLSSQHDNAVVMEPGYSDAFTCFTFPTRSHRCAIAQRDHSSNYVYYVVNVRHATWYQKCHGCGKDKRTNSLPLPTPLATLCESFLKNDADKVNVRYAFSFLESKPRPSAPS